LGVAAAIWLSFAAIKDYRSGLLTIEGYRVAGRGTGIFGNTNDMALHLVTMFPVVAAAVFGSRNKMIKIAAARVRNSSGGCDRRFIFARCVPWTDCDPHFLRAETG
jgi:hypothetical protein